MCDNVIRPANVGSIFRLSDAFGVERLILGGPKIELNRKVWTTSRATEQVVDYEQVEDLKPLLLDYKKNGYTIIALEITTDSKPLSELKLDLERNIVLLTGSERYGINNDLLQYCDCIYHIEMYGQNSSMNVAQATSVALYEIIKWLSHA